MHIHTLYSTVIILGNVEVQKQNKIGMNLWEDLKNDSFTIKYGFSYTEIILLKINQKVFFKYKYDMFIYRLWFLYYKKAKFVDSLVWTDFKVY